MKALRNLLIFIFVVIALFISFAFIVEYYYGDEVKKKLVNELSKKLNTDVEVSEATFSLLKKFPYATLELTDVMVEETFIKLHKDKDTLLFAERLFLQFNVIDIYTRNYNINNIEITNGFAHIHINKAGETNYNFWKMAEDSLNLNKKVGVELEELVLVNMDIRYLSDANKQDYLFNAKHAEIQGELARKQFTLDISGDLNIEWLKIGSVNYVDKKEASVDLNLDVDHKLYTITDGELNIADLTFNVEGEVLYESNNTNVDLKIDGSKLDIRSALSILPEAYSEDVKKYDSSGKFFFQSTIKGIMSSTKDPGVSAYFEIEGGTISKKGSPQELENVKLKGTYTNGDNHSIPSSVLDLTDCNFSIGDGNLGGKLKLTNLKYPRIATEVIGDFDMTKAQEFLKLDTLDVAHGLVGINAVLTATMADNKKGGLEMTRLKTEGSLTAKNVDIKLVGSDNLFNTINGKFIFKDNDLLIDKMNFKLDKSDFYLEGFFRNMAQYILHEDARLTIDAKLKSELIDFNYLLKSRQSDSDTGYALVLPATVNLDLDVDVDSIIFRRFNAHDIAGKIQLKNRQLAAKPLTFETMEGKVKFTGIVDGRNPNEIIISCDANVNQININQLFYQCEDFGQTTLMAHHLMGQGTADIQFGSIWDANLNMDLDRVFAKSNVRIDDGKLINYGPMMELSDYIDLEELKLIEFSSMENHIEIRNQKVFIPLTNIECSALNVKLEGNHSFSNDVDYRFSVKLDEYLSKKARNKRKKNEYHEYDDGTRKGITIFMTMTGTVDEPVIEFDKSETVREIAKDIIEEKIIFKQMLREELGLFKKDTVLDKRIEEEEKEKDNGSDDWEIEFDPEDE